MFNCIRSSKMKKILTILTVALLACSTVFAAVNFSGELVSGYNLNFDKDGNFSGHVFGQDGTDSNTTKLNLGIADDNGVWSVGIEGVLVADGRVSGDLTVDMMKLFGADSDLSVKLGLAANDEQTVLRAYANPSGKNQDRIRTAAAGVQANLTVGYADFVTVNVAGSPKTDAVADGGDLTNAWEMTFPQGPDGKPLTIGETQKPTGFKANDGDVTVSALVTPVDGVAVSHRTNHTCRCPHVGCHDRDDIVAVRIPQGCEVESFIQIRRSVSDKYPSTAVFLNASEAADGLGILEFGECCFHSLNCGIGRA